MSDPGYPDDITGPQLCYIEGCLGKGSCPRCGRVNYALMGYYGAIASAAKRWQVSHEEAESRIIQRRLAKAEAPEEE